MAAVAVPTALTGCAFAILHGFGLVGDWPLGVLLGALVFGAAVSVLGERQLRPGMSPVALHLVVAAQVFGVTVVIYGIGWGPTLGIGYVFLLARMMEDGGARVWRSVVGWTFVAIALGEVAIAAGVVTTYIDAGYAHGLAVLGGLGIAIVMSLLGRKTEQNEQESAATERAALAARSTASLLSATLDATADGILVVDTTGAISHYNRQFVEMWQLPPEIIDQRDDALAMQFVLDQLTHPDLFVAKVQELYAQPESTSDDTLLFKDGRVVERHSCPHLIDGTIAGRVWSFRDITERQRLLDELAHQAFHDNLTGLANRALLRDRLDHALARSRRSAATVVVLFCDLDRFKMINDTLGHETGDHLLVEVSARFEQIIRDEDTVARLGGDEFAIVLDDTDLKGAEVMAQRLLDALREPFTVDDHEVFVRASIGIAANDRDALDADELLCRADIAMYAAKSRGRDRIEVFQAVMQTELATRQELHGDLRHALARGELSLHYQPLINLPTKSIESVEALLRWHHPTRGFIPPDEFIPIAEETGLIIELGRFVLNEACRQTARWHVDLGAPDLSVSVNVSSLQLYDASFINDVRSALDQTGLPARCLTLELTESTLLTDTTTVHKRLHALKDLGVRLAIDDFGTGYSSLAYLRSFPVDYLKIDRSFISELGVGDARQADVMVRSIIDIGHNLNLGIVAEGIEQQSQLDHVSDAGCDTGQGYLFARPAPAPDVLQMLRRHSRDTGLEPSAP